MSVPERCILTYVFTFCLQADRIYHRSPMQTGKSQPEIKRIMPETSFTEFPALSVDPRVEITWSSSETDGRLFFLPVTLKIIKYHSLFLLFMTFYVP